MTASFSAGKWRFVHGKTFGVRSEVSEFELSMVLVAGGVLEKFVNAKRRGKTMLTTRKTKGYHID